MAIPAISAVLPDADPLSRLPPGHAGAERVDYPGHLMAGNPRVLNSWEEAPFVTESLWQMPQASTLTRTDPASGSGIGRPMISKGPFGREIWTTRIVSMVPPVAFPQPRLT